MNHVTKKVNDRRLKSILDPFSRRLCLVRSLVFKLAARYAAFFWPVSIIVAAGTLTICLEALASGRAVFGFDSWAYWHPPHNGPDLYAATGDGTTWFGVYRYSPAFLDLIWPLQLLNWEFFRLVWFALLIVCLIWLAGRWSLFLMGIPMVAVDIIQGNINLFLAAAIVLGFRYPATWSFVLLTKVTPGVGLLWFVVRREWRPLLIAIGTTVGLVGISLVLRGPGVWIEWLTSLAHTSTPDAGSQIPIPLGVRLALSVLFIAWGALHDRRWTVVVAATLAMPIPWWPSLAMLVGLFGLRQKRG